MGQNYCCLYQREICDEVVRACEVMPEKGCSGGDCKFIGYRGFSTAVTNRTIIVKRSNNNEHCGNVDN